jgi:hypothetical protein
MYAAATAIKAAEDRLYPGRIIIYPHLIDLPLMSIQELGQKYPTLMESLSDGSRWTAKAESRLMELFGGILDSTILKY